MKPAILPFLLLASAATAQTPPPAEGQKPVMPLRAPQEFVCSDGQLVSLEVDEAAGILRGVRAGEVFTLQQQVGFAPPRFVSGSDTVVLDGDVAKLRRGRAIAEQSCGRLPASPAIGSIWGTLTKLDRMALPPGARAKVLLVDAARADAPAVELASAAIVTTGNQVPLHFLLAHDPARLAHPARPVLQARIEDPSGRLLYITDTANPIPTDSPAPSPVELRLVPVPRP